MCIPLFAELLKARQGKVVGIHFGKKRPYVPRVAILGHARSVPTVVYHLLGSARQEAHALIVTLARCAGDEESLPVVPWPVVDDFVGA